MDRSIDRAIDRSIEERNPMAAHVTRAPEPGGYYQEVDQEGDPLAAPGAVVTRDSDGTITDVDLDAADRYEAAKGFPASNDYASGYAD
jgi:hypothetical protein